MTGFEAVTPEPGDIVDERALAGFLISGGMVSADELAATPQNPSFHAEGNVWSHTRLALEALVASPAWLALDDVGRAVTFAATLLHDIGKPATTRVQPDGSITSLGHSVRGERMARRWLWHRSVPFGVREHVCALVGQHQVPFFGITRPEPDAARTATRLSLRLRHDWLALVAEADARGRRCTDPAEATRMLDHIALWVELCRELGCLDRPLAFASDHGRVLYFEADDPRARPPEIVPYDDTTSEVVIMSGLPASGKDRWLSLHRPDLPVVSLDALREANGIDPSGDQGAVVAAAREAAREHLRAGRSFAWNATNLSQRLRSGVIGLARRYRARIHVVYCEAAEDELQARQCQRSSPVPRAAIDRMLERWTMPGLDEVHRITWAVSDAGPLPWPPR